jgi:hypothetical protein
MKSIISSAFLLCFFISGFACHKNKSAVNNQTAFDSLPVLKPVVPLIEEASGIADSKLNPGYLWVEQDSGNPPELYLLGHDGKVLKKIFIEDAVNRDWEDMAISGDNLYVADIGDNNRSYADYSVYYFPEPSSAIDTIKNAIKISFQYPDGAHDAEAFLVDGNTKDIFIITKQDNPSKIYKIAYPYKTGSVNTASLVGNLSYGGVVSAAISGDGKEILIKTYFGINYYSRNTGQTIVQALQTAPKSLSYAIEPQGEAICFNKDNTGFYTLSEKGMGSTVNLYFYSKK